MEFKVYYSKTSALPCVEVGDSVLKGEVFECHVPIKGKWFRGESPSWALVGKANKITHETNQEGVSTIKIE